MTFQVKRLKQVTLPVLKIEKNTTRYFFFKGPMSLGKKLDDQKEPATIMHAVDLETGEEGLIICPAIMVKELHEAYPKDGYVGKCFELTLTRVPDKRYNLVSLCEIADPREDAAESSAKVRKAA
jgi:hypothetical protein